MEKENKKMTKNDLLVPVSLHFKFIRNLINGRCNILSRHTVGSL